MWPGQSAGAAGAACDRRLHALTYRLLLAGTVREPIRSGLFSLAFFSVPSRPGLLGLGGFGFGVLWTRLSAFPLATVSCLVELFRPEPVRQSWSSILCRDGRASVCPELGRVPAGRKRPSLPPFQGANPGSGRGVG